MKRLFIHLSIMIIAATAAMSLAPTHAHVNAAWTAPAGSHARIETDRFIVTYRQDSAEASDRQAAVQNVSAAFSRAGLDRPAPGTLDNRTGRSTVRYLRKLALGSDLIGVSSPLDDTQARRLMDAIAADPAVVHVERDVRLHALPGPSRPMAIAPRLRPFDPSPTVRWNYNDPRGGANIEQAWPLADGKDVVVAVLDTGITRHPGIDLSLADAGYDFIRDEFTSGRTEYGRVPGGWDTGDWSHTPDYEDCFDGPGGEASSWHGTKVAGIIAGQPSGSDGFKGIAPQAKVLPVRVLGHCGGNLADIADAILWAAGGHVRGISDNPHPAQVIHLGFGDFFEDGCTETFSLQNAIAEANRRGTVVVAPAGNFAGDVAFAVPASCPGVIAVAANGVAGDRAAYSSFGSGIALAAPGGRGQVDGAVNGTIWSTSNQGTAEPAEPGYAGSSGTGLAAAHVAGAAALVISAVKQAGLPVLAPEQIRDLLVATARAFPVIPDLPIGAGILDAQAAVLKALDGRTHAEPVAQLERGQIRSGQTLAEGESRIYAIEVPAGANYLHLRTFGGTGDATLYVKSGAAPSFDGADADATSDKPGNGEAIVIPRPESGTWYLRVHARQPLHGLTVMGTYSL